MNVLKIAAASSFIAGLSHATLQAYEHQSMPIHMVGFILAGIAQMAWGYYIYREKNLPPHWYWSGILVNGFSVGFWFITRTIPMPFMGEVEHFSTLGWIIAFLEILVLVTLWFHHQKRHHLWIIPLITIGLCGGVYVLAMMTEAYFPQLKSEGGHHHGSSESPKPITAKKEKVWQYVAPRVAKDFTSIKLPAKVKSNKFAIIAPRRVGIIQDLLVDIGDEIFKGQTIGYLFPEGVEGQGSSAIAQASAQLQKARAELADALGVSQDAINFAEKGVSETQTRLGNLTENNQGSRAQIQQKYDEARTVATQSFENLKRMLFGSTNLNNANRDILGNFSNRNQENLVKNSIETVERMEVGGLTRQDEIYEHLNHVTSLLKDSETLYKGAKEQGTFSANLIEKNLKSIQSEQIRILRAQESLDDVLLAAQEVESTLEKSQESLNLVKSQQSLSITQAQNAVEVAQANYNAALVKSGHQTIIAPFSGKISGRGVEVGQGVTPNTILFYLEDTPTQRSGESVFEIHFQIPESWIGKVSVKDAVEIKKSATGETFPGQIFRLSDQINLQTGMMMATAILIDSPLNLRGDAEGRGDTSLIHGQSVFISLQDNESSIFTVPTQALKKRGTEYFLWKMVDENPVKVQVEVLAEDGEFSQVFTTEITTEDQVISNPSVSLFRN